MNTKSLFALLLILLNVSTFAQVKVFSFNEIQSRNKVQKWEKCRQIDDRVAYFSEQNIDLTVDKYYHLTIVSTTFLPNNGTIYLCKDEQQNNITVTLINEDRMFLYNDTKRFMINFKHNVEASPMNAAFADSSDD